MVSLLRYFLASGKSDKSDVKFLLGHVKPLAPLKYGLILALPGICWARENWTLVAHSYHSAMSNILSYVEQQ